MVDVLVIGGGIIGLATAIELTLRGAKVTILERGECGQEASWAAAGMLAPEAEGLQGELLDLGLQSRALYPEWIDKITHLSAQDCGYWQCGILSPTYELNDEIIKHPKYIDVQQLVSKQSNLSHSIQGGLWFPEDAQVDNRRLTRALIIAARALGVTIQEGVAVYRLVTTSNQVQHLETSNGIYQADRYLLAMGARSSELLPLPISPRKGQMLSLIAPQPELRCVLFGPDVYVVPRSNGHIVIGATVEDVGFTPGNTAAGIKQLLEGAIKVYPAIASMPIQSTWWGFRPFAPHEIPLLGASQYENLSLATGHYRNGILFAPITAKLLTDWIIEGKRSHPLVNTL